jgi:hypothetical protein
VLRLDKNRLARLQQGPERDRTLAAEPHPFEPRADAAQGGVPSV